MTREEAINLVKQVLPCLNVDEKIREGFKTLIPELAESEDERIRKALIEVFKKKLEKGFEWVEYGIPNRSVLDWLEKQKDSVSNAKYIEDVAHAFEDGRKKGIEEEQKPAEWSDTKEFIFKEICNHLEVEGYGGWVWLLNALHNGEFQPKQEWSEEDETHRAFILESLEDHIRFCKKDAKGAYCAKQIQTAQNWLKSLTERFNLQPQQEWSEEDEKKIIFLERLIEHNVPDGQYGWVDGMKGGFVTKSEAISMLKSLRPQYHGDVTMTEAYKMGLEAGKASSWKPSNEQMKALESCGQCNKQVYSLYLDLKKYYSYE